MFEETGCEECRDAWSMGKNRDRILKEVGGTNFERQARLNQCSECGAYWEDNNGSYPSGLSENDAKKFYKL